MSIAMELLVVLKIIAPVVPWLLVVVGWYIARHDNNQREDRHELRSIIDTITKDINTLEDKAYDYYLQAQSDEAIRLQVKILNDQQALIARIQRLRHWDERFRDQESLFTFRSALTGGDFAQSDRPSRIADDDVLKEVSFASKNLIEQLEFVYVQKYKHLRR